MNESRYVRIALERALQSIITSPLGKRNEVLNKAAYAMGRLVGGNLADGPIIEGALLGAAMSAGLGKDESLKTIKSGMDAGERRPKIMGVAENRYAVRTKREPMPAGPIVSLTHWERKDRPKDGKREPFSFPELVSMVTWPLKCENPENAPQLSFGVFRDNHRKGEALQSVTALVIDADHPDLGISALPKLFPGCTFVAHTTKRHTPESPRWRAFFPLSRPVSAFEYRILLEWFAGLITGMDKCPPSQAFYVPIATANYQHVTQEGSLFDADSTLEYQATVPKKAETPPSWERQRDLDARRVCWAVCREPELVTSLQVSLSDLPGATQRHLLAWVHDRVTSGEPTSILDVRNASCVAPSYIDALVREMKDEDPGDLPTWVGRLQRASLRDEAITVIRAASTAVIDEQDPEDSINDFEIAKQIISRDHMIVWDELTDDTCSWFQNTQTGVRKEFLPTGFDQLDDIAQPQAGNLVIVGARTFVGKTTFMLQVAHHLADHGTPVAWFSAEMTGREVFMRLISHQNNIPLHLLLKANALSDAEIVRVSQSFEAVGALPIHLSEVAVPERICANARRVQRTHGIKAVFIDYLQILQPPALAGKAKAETRNLELAATIGMFRDLAHETGLVVYVASQVSRGDPRRENECPGLAGLRDSGQIEQDANIVYMLHRLKDEEAVQIKVLKNRTTLQLGEITRPVENGFIAP